MNLVSSQKENVNFFRYVILFFVCGLTKKPSICDLMFSEWAFVVILVAEIVENERKHWIALGTVALTFWTWSQTFPRLVAHQG